MLKPIVNWFGDPSLEPDFKQIVEKSLSLFAVFTGVVMTFYIKDFLFGDKIPVGFMDFPLWSRTSIALTVVCLLLRYIVGSAVHLNATYIKVVTVLEATSPGKYTLVETKDPKSKSLGWLFFDILTLVGFGLLAVLITYATDLELFLYYCGLSVGAGMVWSVVALGLREQDRCIALRWLAIDCFQLAFTGLLIVVPGYDLSKTLVLAVVYGFCLFLDFCVVSRPPK